MSHALYETTEPYYPSRDHSPKDFSEYVMPGPHEIPEIECVVLEHPSSNGPYGAKGVGEMTANCPIPAIVNAIHDATGIRFDSLPVTPEMVLRGLEAKQRSERAEPAADGSAADEPAAGRAVGVRR
jgi:CO/xanthine dehydrogenase Mo-binding subunit